MSEEEYVALKEKTVDKMLKMFKDKAGVDLSGHIEEVSIASPWTFARYLNVPEGAVYGSEVVGWDNMMPRMMTLALDFPVKGLRPIGAAGPRGDGYSGCMITGNIVAKLAIKDLNEWAKEA